MKYSKEFYEQQSLRRDRLKRQSQLSERKTTAQNLAKQGISTDDSQPYERERVLEDDLEDEALQIKQAQKNIAQLFKDKEEAAILLNRLRSVDSIPSFNAKFPRIFRELKSNYGDIKSDDAYYIILDVISSQNEALTNKSFDNILTSHMTQIKNEMKNINNKSEEQKLKDDLMKLDAVKKTYKRLNPEGKEILESLEDMETIINFVDDDGLNRIYNEEGNKDDEYIEEDDEYEEEERDENALIRQFSAEEIEQLFIDADNESLKGIATDLGINLKSLKAINTAKNNKKKGNNKRPSGAEYIAKRLIKANNEVNKEVKEEEEEEEEEENNAVIQELRAADIDKMFENKDDAFLQKVANALKMTLTSLKGTYTKKNNNLKIIIGTNKYANPSNKLELPLSGGEHIAMRVNSLPFKLIYN
jgi:hypothetical protein